MSEPPLPNWFQVSWEGLRRELQEIKDSQVRLETKADAIHDETRKTNGRVTALERSRDEGTAERRHKQQWIGGGALGMVGAVMLIIVVEILKHYL